jgi:hypothetical protein
MSLPRSQRLSPAGVFPNGVTAVAVVQFIRDHDESARIDDVAAYFGLEADDVAAALDYWSAHLRRLPGIQDADP